MTKLTILYATRGGMGDVGKFAVAYAQQAGVQVRAVALSDESVDWKPVSSNLACSYVATDPKDIGADNIDVTDPLLKEIASKALKEAGVTKIEIASARGAGAAAEGARGCGRRGGLLGLTAKSDCVALVPVGRGEGDGGHAISRRVAARHSIQFRHRRRLHAHLLHLSHLGMSAADGSA